MPSTRRSRPKLTSSDCRVISELYFICERDYRKIKDHPECPKKFEFADLVDPRIRALIEEGIRKGIQMVSREEHLAELKNIRDLAKDEGQLRIALAAEIARGNAAGLYDRTVDLNASTSTTPPTELSTEEIRNRLAQAGNRLPQPEEGEIADFEELEDDDE